MVRASRIHKATSFAAKGAKDGALQGDGNAKPRDVLDVLCVLGGERGCCIVRQTSAVLCGLGVLGGEDRPPPDPVFNLAMAKSRLEVALLVLKVARFEVAFRKTKRTCGVQRALGRIEKAKKQVAKWEKRARNAKAAKR